MKIVLIIPPRPYLFNQKALPNLGILTVAAAAKNLGCQVEIIDLADGEGKLPRQYLLPLHPKDRNVIYGMYVTTPDFPTCISILKLLKEYGSETVIAGGPHATSAPLECMDAGFDIVSVGDGEATLPCILKTPYPGGLVKEYLKNFDDAPHPDRTIIDLKKYDFKIADVPATSIMTATGCAWHSCAFCSRPTNDILRYHSSKWVVEDLDQVASLGFRGVQIYDDEFLTNPRRDLVIINALSERGMTWRCFGHSRFLLKNKDLVEKASKSGLREVLIGVESGSNRILGLINKGTSAEWDLKAIKLLHKFNVDVKCAMIVGLPGESEKTLKETWLWCEEAEPYVKDWDFTIFVPYPGSNIYNHPEMFDIKFDKKASYTAYKGAGSQAWTPPKISTRNLTYLQIQNWRDKLERRFKGIKY